MCVMNISGNGGRRAGEEDEVEDDQGALLKPSTLMRMAMAMVAWVSRN